MRLTIYNWIRRTLKSPRLVKSLRQRNRRAYKNSCGKVMRPLTIWAQQNLQLLTSSKSGWRALVQILVDSVDSHTCRPQVIWRLRPLYFYGRRLSRTVPACCTCMTCQNFCGCPILCARRNFHHFLWKIKNSISASRCPITASLPPPAKSDGEYFPRVFHVVSPDPPNWDARMTRSGWQKSGERAGWSAVWYSSLTGW